MGSESKRRRQPLTTAAHRPRSLDLLARRLHLFAREPGSVFLISSHLIEVGPDLEATGAVACSRFEAAEGADGLEYDFVLRPGISSQRLGMRVLEEEGVFELRERSALRRERSL